MAAPKTLADVRLAANAPLSPIEQRVLAIYAQAAKSNLPAPSIETIAKEIGAQGVATVPGITKRLEQKGYITREVYQRGRMICIKETGQCTVPPRDTSPHWRLRTENVPTPAIQAVRERSRSIAVMIEAEARMSGKHISDFLTDLVYIGWHGYQAEKEGEA